MTIANTSRTCPLCGSSEHSREAAKESYDPGQLDKFAYASRKMPEYMHYRLVHCEECDLLYASPVPSLDHLEDEYREAAYDSKVEARFAACTYARLLRPVVARLPGRDGALDIGAGDGAFLRELLDCGFTRVAGVEPSRAPIAAADDAIRPLLRHAMFRAEDFAQERFRLITCFQTLEHVPDPLGLCRDACGLLADGGAMRRPQPALILGQTAETAFADLRHRASAIVLACKRAATPSTGRFSRCSIGYDLQSLSGELLVAAIPHARRIEEGCYRGGRRDRVRPLAGAFASGESGHVWIQIISRPGTRLTSNLYLKRFVESFRDWDRDCW